jgi:hypothetical protein
MKIDIMFLVPARMGFICRTKIFHYSLFLKNRLNKTLNWSPDQSLIAAFRKRNSNCIFLKILLARLPLFFMSALVCVEIYCRVGRIKLKWIIHRFTSDFYGSRKLLISRIQIQKIMKNEKIPLQIFENCGRETWYQFSLALKPDFGERINKFDGRLHSCNSRKTLLC